MVREPVQIFLSYSWRDNRIPPDDPYAKKGFVAALCEQLVYEFEDHDPKPVLWWDRGKIDDAQQFDPMIENAINCSSLFLIVLSNHWLSSNFCLREFQLFRQRWKQESDFDFKHRIISVRTALIPKDRQPEFLRTQRGFNFFSISEVGGVETPYFHRGKGTKEFFEMAVELGRALAKRTALLSNEIGQIASSYEETDSVEHSTDNKYDNSSQKIPVKLANPKAVQNVFISCCSKDKHVGDAICEVLEGCGTKCWVATRDIVPGSGWAKSIVEAINGAGVMVLVFSEKANASPQIEIEVERAINKGIPIITLRVEEVTPTGALEYFLSARHWLDAFTPPLAQHLDRLARAVQTLLKSKGVGK